MPHTAVCGACSAPVDEHFEFCMEPDCDDLHPPPLCCPSCLCLSYYQAHPESAEVPEALKHLARELLGAGG